MNRDNIIMNVVYGCDMYSAIRMPTFARGDGSVAEASFKHLVYLLHRHLRLNEDDELPYLAVNQGAIDKKHAYITVTCSQG